MKGSKSREEVATLRLRKDRGAGSSRDLRINWGSQPRSLKRIQRQGLLVAAGEDGGATSKEPQSSQVLSGLMVIAREK